MLDKRSIFLSIQLAGIVVLLLSAVLIFRYFGDSSSEGSQEGSQQSGPAGQLFAAAPVINRSGKFIKVPHRQEYLPGVKENFLLFFWVNIRNLPAEGERLVLLSKYSGEPPNISGYAIGVRRDGSISRPVVYWGDGSRAGSWFDFPEISLVAGEWNLFALNVYKGRFLSLYSASYVGEVSKGLSYLGGYEVDPELCARLGEADLILGAPPGRDFRGRLGPFGIISPFEFKLDETADALKKYVSTPEDFKLLGAKDNLQLLVVDKINKARLNGPVEVNF